VAKLANTGKTHLATEVPANHCQAGRTTVHLVDLLHVRYAADSPLVAGTEPAFLGVRGLGLLLIDRNLVLHPCFCRKQLFRKIKRHTRHHVGLILRETFLE
jgi:hypothetical protein